MAILAYELSSLDAFWERLKDVCGGVEGVSSYIAEGVEWVLGGSVVSPFREGVREGVLKSVCVGVSCGGVSADSASLGSLLEFCICSALSIGRFRDMSPD